MSSTESNSIETPPAPPGPRPPRGSIALVVVSIGLLGVLVWALNPSQPKIAPAPLRNPPPGCPKWEKDFTPSDLTALPGIGLETLSREQRFHALYRLNMEPCPCGCNYSIASCLINHLRCEVCPALARKIVTEEKEGHAAPASPK